MPNFTKPRQARYIRHLQLTIKDTMERQQKQMAQLGCGQLKHGSNVYTDQYMTERQQKQMTQLGCGQCVLPKMQMR